ncbi:glycosyltransferase [Kocuria sp.]|uniref:glycosyltransferase n=1 Tax=Kocuria sp. TaxID=1871328 RepID=UPI0026DF8295|nr:glycosyltransferase [Kocuria sp.]MDO5617799.1 glycosyltransferase [Kocuria sp.]
MSDSQYYSSAAFRSSMINKPESIAWRPSRTPQEYQQRRAAVSRAAEVEALVEASANLPGSNGSRLLVPHRVKVALLCDALLFDALDGTAEIRYISPQNWQETLDWADTLLVASTWRGRFEDWHGTIGGNNLLRAEVIPYARAHDVPVIFYSKEDPPNFAKFLPVARDADFIVTSDDLKIPEYTQECPDARNVVATTFGVNPALHHPIGSRRQRDQRVLFAGSWLQHKYPKRQQAARQLFEGVLDSGRDLLILDRNSSLGDPNYHYPDQYLPYLGPGVGHDDLMRLQRTVDVHLNLNSVNYSPTMFANRVVELLAMGALVVSNYSMAVNDLFPEVQIIDKGRDVGATLDAVSGEHRYRTQMDGIRRAFTQHTSHARMADILGSAGFHTSHAQPRVAVTAEQITPEIMETAGRQSLGVEVLDHQALKNRREDFDVVVPINPAYRYGPDHVQDLVNGFAYTASDVVTRLGHEAGGEVIHREAHEFVHHDSYDSGRSAVWMKSQAGDALLDQATVGGHAYTIDPFGVDTQPTTCIVLAEPATDGSQPVTRQDTVQPIRAGDPELTVIVPVYNNGRFLEHKCFRSLQRSSVFERMEILLIDDGSTDGITPQIVQNLAQRFPQQVRAFGNPTGGSGSASRARNQGLHMATAPFVTYLDPDNEALGDGFAHLLEIVKRTGVDFAIGNMLKLSTRRWRVDNTGHLSKHLPLSWEGGLASPADALERINFQPMSIQALVAQTGWLRGIGLHQPLGALGQDSYAFQQMLHGARRVALAGETIHVYYGAVSNSMVNTVGPGFFRKYLPMEQARSEWLKDQGLYQSYCQTRARPFLAGWILNKLNKDVAPEAMDECRELVRQLAAFYEIKLEEQLDQDGHSILTLVDPPADPEAAPETQDPSTVEIDVPIDHPRPPAGDS